MGSGKRISILQSNYIPWKGYFDLMAAVDEFLIFDEVQFTKRDWRNHNRCQERQRVLADDTCSLDRPSGRADRRN